MAGDTIGCPALARGEERTRLFLPRGGHRFLSRAAYPLGYAGQREMPSDRPMHKRRLHHALGGKGDPFDKDAADKPKWMHRQTHEWDWPAATEAVEAGVSLSVPISKLIVDASPTPLCPDM